MPNNLAAVGPGDADLTCAARTPTVTTAAGSSPAAVVASPIPGVPRGGEHLHDAGATIHRVILENELESEYQAFLQEPNRDRDDSDGSPERSLLEIESWAHAHNLPCDDQGHVQFPDVRVEYDIDGRDRTTEARTRPRLRRILGGIASAP